MPAPRRDPDEERRKLFRRMEWFYVYLPPLLAVLVAVLVGGFLAWAVHLPGTTFATRWGMGVGLILGLPLIAYLVKGWWEKR